MRELRAPETQEAAAKQEAVIKTDAERAKETMAQWVKDDAPAASGDLGDAAAPDAEEDEDPDEGDLDSFPHDDEDLPTEASTDAADVTEVRSSYQSSGGAVAIALQYSYRQLPYGTAQLPAYPL